VSGQGKWKVASGKCLGLDSTEVLALFFEISMHGASSIYLRQEYVPKLDPDLA